MEGVEEVSLLPMGQSHWGLDYFTEMGRAVQKAPGVEGVSSQEKEILALGSFKNGDVWKTGEAGHSPIMNDPYSDTFIIFNLIEH